MTFKKYILRISSTHTMYLNQFIALLLPFKTIPTPLFFIFICKTSANAFIAVDITEIDFVHH